MYNKNNSAADMKNTLLALVLSGLILFCWEYFIEMPRKQAQALAIKAQAQTEQQTKKEVAAEAEAVPVVPRSREQLVADSPRVHINSLSLHGSIALKGLRIDDLTLARYRQTLDPDSPDVTLFSPAGDTDAYFAEFGWLPDNAVAKVPTPDTVWTASGNTLAPGQPVTLTWNNGAGVTFSAAIALDDNYMFTIDQTATDASGKPLNMRAYAYINRVWDPKQHPAAGLLHEGPLGVFDGTLSESAYKKLTEDGEKGFEADTGWLGITDKYWLSAFIPPQGAFTGRFSYYESRARPHYQVDYAGPAEPRTEIHFFAGAKVLSLLDTYAAQYHIPLFDRAVDFGWLWFIAKPMFLLLEYFHALVGNFGVAILLLTLVVKLVMFPLANKSFVAMNRMKVLQPKMKDIQERYKDDKMKMNNAIMELYKREKVNPASGCLPMLVQIPIFFALYRLLTAAIEMRQAPFYGWVHDLSASDPTNLFNLFGLAPWGDPVLPAWLPFVANAHVHIGVWPLLFCLTMIVQQRQSPPPPDPAQAQMMKYLPFMFLFLFSGVAAGLAIYWTWSNSLSILQQWYIKRRHAPVSGKK